MQHFKDKKKLFSFIFCQIFCVKIRIVETKYPFPSQADEMSQTEIVVSTSFCSLLSDLPSMFRFSSFLFAFYLSFCLVPKLRDTAWENEVLQLFDGITFLQTMLAPCSNQHLEYVDHQFVRFIYMTFKQLLERKLWYYHKQHPIKQ